MNTFIVLALSATSLAQQLYTDAQVTKNASGALVETFVSDDHILKTITQPHLDFAQDYSQIYEHITTLTQNVKDAKNQNNIQAPIYTCSDREPSGDPTSAGALLPVYVTAVNSDATTFEYFGSKCFETIVFEFESVDQNTFNIHIQTGKKTGILCKEAFLFANTEIFHMEVFAFQGNHTLQFKTNSFESQTDMNFGGLKIFEFCDGLVETIESAFKTVKCFLGGLGQNPDTPVFGSHVPNYMEKANVEFLHEAMQYDLEPRETKKVVIDSDLIQDGDMLAVMRLDGLDQIIMYGTGAYLGHNTMALRFDGELYIVESQAAWYWPKVNLQRTKWEDWLQYAENADFHVAHLPMREEIRKNFDNEAAVDFFWETEGLPYGYHNFLYGWIDTPNSNLPGLLANEMLPILFSVIEAIAPVTVFNFFTEALNLRLGTNNLNIAQVAAEAANRGMSIQELMAEPEQDGWVYYGEEPRDGRSWVCSAYVAAMYKAAGLFGDMEINSTEFGPQDVYQLNFFDEDFARPQQCVDADPNLPYCQLLGNYRLRLPKYNTITPYEHMNEHCADVWPEYTREEGC